MKIEIKDSRFYIFFIVISFVTTILLLPYYELSFAQKDNGNDEEEDEDDKDKDKLVVKAHINLKNIDLEKTKFIRVVGFINGEDIKQDIPISSIDNTNKKTLDVDLKTDIENEIVEADTPDEFFVCAYQVGDVLQQELLPLQNLIVMKETCCILINLQKLDFLLLALKYMLTVKQSMMLI